MEARGWRISAQTGADCHQMGYSKIGANLTQFGNISHIPKWGQNLTNLSLFIDLFFNTDNVNKINELFI